MTVNQWILVIFQADYCLLTIKSEHRKVHIVTHQTSICAPPWIWITDNSLFFSEDIRKEIKATGPSPSSLVFLRPQLLIFIASLCGCGSKRKIKYRLIRSLNGGKSRKENCQTDTSWPGGAHIWKWVTSHENMSETDKAKWEHFGKSHVHRWKDLQNMCSKGHKCVKCVTVLVKC